MFFFSGGFGVSSDLFSDLWFGGGLWCVLVGGLGSPGVSVFTGMVGAGCSGRRRVFRPPEFAGGSPELCFQSQKGPIFLEVILGTPLQFLVSVFSAVFFSPSGSGWFSSSPSAVAAVLGFLSLFSSVGSLPLSAGFCFHFLSCMPL